MTDRKVGKQGAGGRGRALLVAGTLALATPAAALGQACLGSAALPGQFAISGTGSITSGGTGYAGGIRGNLPGGASAAGTYEVWNVDDAANDITGFGAELAYELDGDDFSACPLVGVGRSSWDDDVLGEMFELTELTIPVGFGIGVRLGEAGGPQLIPAGQAGIRYARIRGTATTGGVTLEEERSETSAFIRAGATLAYGALFTGVTLSTTSASGSEPVFSLSAGVVF